MGLGNDSVKAMSLLQRVRRSQGLKALPIPVLLFASCALVMTRVFMPSEAARFVRNAFPRDVSCSICHETSQSLLYGATLIDPKSVLLGGNGNEKGVSNVFTAAELLDPDRYCVSMYRYQGPVACIFYSLVIEKKCQ
jgi:hypothetical protein